MNKDFQKNKNKRKTALGELILVILFAVSSWFGLLLIEILPIYPVGLFLLDSGMAALLNLSAGIYFLAAILNAILSYLFSFLLIRIIFPGARERYRKLIMLLTCSYLNLLSLSSMIKYSKYFKDFLWLLLPLAAIVGGLLVFAALALLLGVFKNPKFRIWSVFIMTASGILIWHIFIVSRFRAHILSIYVAVILTIAAAHIGILMRALKGSGIKVPFMGLGNTLLILFFACFVPLLLIIFNHFYHSIEMRSEQAAPPDRPNVVILLIDTLRADHCSLHGYDRGTTKRLSEKIGPGYTVFNNAISPASSTIPSVKSLFSSRPASYYGFELYSKPPPESEYTLPSVFFNNGYQTACFSSNELIKEKGFESGFQSFFSWSGLLAARRIIAIHDFLCYKDGMKVFDFVRRTRSHYPKGEVLLRLIEKWLPEHKEQSFFLYIHTLDPHWPYYSHDLNMIPEPYRKYNDDLIFTELLNVETEDLADHYRKRAEFFNLVGRYDEEICYSDYILHQLSDMLIQQNSWDDTLLIITSDHGEEFFEHDRFSHGHDVWEELIHVPLIIKWPKKDDFHLMPRFMDAPVGLIDIMPTLIDYLDLGPSPPQIYGRSLRPFLENKEAPPGTSLFSESIYKDVFRAAYREGHLKLRLEFSTDISPLESSEFQIFDLAEDPREQVEIPIDEPSISDFRNRGQNFWQEIWELWGDKQRIESDPQLKEELEQLKALGYI